MRTSINRNILECKSLLLLLSYKEGRVLIETYWNVNSEVVMANDLKYLGINRNILECKF